MSNAIEWGVFDTTQILFDASRTFIMILGSKVISETQEVFFFPKGLTK